MIITGKTGDGTFSRKALGVFTHPNGKEWGSEPYTPDQKRYYNEYNREGRIIDTLIEYGIDCKEALLKEIELINKGKSNLSSTYRRYILSYEQKTN